MDRLSCLTAALLAFGAISRVELLDESLVASLVL
jgi:hypothetical protein